MRARVFLVVAVMAVVMSACSRHEFNLSPECPKIGDGSADSEISGAITLMIQSVPEAAVYPCVERLRPGWDITDVDAEKGRTTIALSSDRLGFEFLRVYLLPSCQVADDATVYPTMADEAGTTLYEDIHKTLAGPDEEGEYEGSWWYVFDGGCVEFRFKAEGPGVDRISDDIRESFSFFQRAPIDDLVERELGIRP